MDKQLKNLPGADGIRALACLLVVWHHTTQRFNPQNSADWIQGIHFLGMRGEVGVSLFFVLSGCLLSLPFWNAFIEAQPIPKLKIYAQNRAARIIPAYWLNLVLCTMASIWFFGQEINWTRLISGILFVNSYHYVTFFPAELNGPLWSIGLEVSCYVLLPFVLFLVMKSSKKFSSALIRLISFILVLQVLNAVIVNNFMTGDQGKGWEYGLIGGAKLWLPYWNIATFFTQFLCGSIAALIIITLRSRGFQKYIILDLLTLLIVILATVLISIRVKPGTPDTFTNQPYIAPFFAILMAALIVTVAFSKHISVFLGNKLFRWIANLSFGIYLWHVFIINVIERVFLESYTYYGLSNLFQWILVSFVVLFSSILIAQISWRFLESPILKLARAKN